MDFSQLPEEAEKVQYPQRKKRHEDIILLILQILSSGFLDFYRFFLSDRINRIARIFFLSQLPEEAEKTPTSCFSSGKAKM